MKVRVLFTSCLALMTTLAFAQNDRLWSANNESRSGIVTDKAVARESYPKDYRLFNLNIAAMQGDLFAVAGRGAAATTVISLPNADGQLEQFEVFEASNFEPALQAKFPEIRAYSGRGITDKFAVLKLSISPQGVQTMVFRTEKENEFIEPYSRDHKVYAVYRSHREKGSLPWTCSTEDQTMFRSISGQVATTASAVGASAGTIKTMRLAQSCNGEYANFFGAFGPSQVGLVLAAYNATLTRCNGVYEKDLALHLNLIAATTNVIYYNPSTDPYSSRLSRWNAELQSTLTSVIGEANYDIGHMFGASGGGGNAGCIGCVCVNGSKGSGITSPADGVPMGDNFDIDYVAHEVGHQLGANHTFSMSLEGTGQNKEVGSGITIMGYAGITSYDVARHSIDIFHQTSIAQIQANLANKTCPTTISMTDNHAPVVSTGSNYTIPFSTPFALSGAASDQDNDALTYNWEQNDNATTSGSGSVASPTKTTGPNWLSYPSTSTPTRLFPKLSTILAGGYTTLGSGNDANVTVEALSSVARTLNFRLTVRDNHPYVAGSSIGQTAFSDVRVVVSAAAGPFAVTTPNTNLTWSAGSTQSVTWSVNSTNLSPINCQLVNILLSTDGGETFPITLAANTPNDGTQSITVPAVPGTNNRVKVEAVGNIFFDICNSNFTITGGVACGAPAGLNASGITTTSATLSWNAVSGASSYDVDYKLTSSSLWTSVASGTNATIASLSALSAGSSYDWRVSANCTSGSSNYSTAQFTTATPVCNAPGGLSSTVTETSAALSWSAVAGAAGYDVDYKTTSSSTWISAATNTTATSANVTGLAPGTSYNWRVRTRCGSSTSDYSENNFTTSAATGCGDATGLTASNVSTGSVTLGWNAVSGAVSYTVDYKENSSATWLATGNTAGSSLDLTGLAAGTAYDWRVRANCSASSGNFVSSQFTTANTAPACPGIYDVSSNSAAGGAATIPLNTDVYGMIDVRGNSDYYKFVITTAGTGTISLTNLPADYHLALLSAGQALLQSSTNNGPADELINYNFAPGTYYVRIYPKNNGQLNGTLCYLLRVETGTATRFPAEVFVSTEKPVLVSPNPATSKANITFRTERAGVATISIIAPAGNVLRTFTTGVHAGSNTREMNVADMTNGTYFIRIVSNGISTMTRLVVGR